MLWTVVFIVRVEPSKVVVKIGQLGGSFRSRAEAMFCDQEVWGTREWGEWKANEQGKYAGLRPVEAKQRAMEEGKEFPELPRADHHNA